MTKYSTQGQMVFLTNELNVQQYDDLLAPATYMVSFNPKLGYFLMKMPGFELPKKLYGNCHDVAQRFLQTAQDRKGTTGVLLAGTKGSGKSLTMKNTAIEGQKLGWPTIMVNSSYCGDDFNAFIQSIEQPAIIIFDEFEKVYEQAEQERLLTLLDGNFTSQKLIIMTCNDKYKINTHMINRPGRLFYYLKYAGLDERFVLEYCADNLKDQSKTKAVVALSRLIREFNFDMLQAIVEEVNRYGETVKKAVSILNVEIPQNDRSTYEVFITDPEGEKVKRSLVYPAVSHSPMSQRNIELIVYSEKRDEEGDRKEAKTLSFHVDDIKPAWKNGGTLIEFTVEEYTIQYRLREDNKQVEITDMMEEEDFA